MLILFSVNPDCPLDEDALLTELENIEQAMDNKRAAERFKALGFKVTDP